VSTEPIRTGEDAGYYTTTQRLLHWIIFGLITAQYAVGAVMPHIGRKTPDESWVSWHMSIGATILFFICWRLLMRFLQPVSLLETGPKWQQILAALTHASIYLLILVMCILGWAAASYQGWTIYIFGFVPLPHLAATGTGWAHTAGDVHDILLYVLLVPIVLHLLAALYHQYVLGDGVFTRMTLPARH
jgi:cytochrome b561